MAAKFTEVTLEDMERFLKRAYRALRPKKGEERGEVYYDLNLSDNKIFIRVWTSLRTRSGKGAEKGTDAIRVTMLTKNGRPLVKKMKIVKRTQNWRNSLQDRIETLLEDYEAKIEYWKSRQTERDSEKEDKKEEGNTAPPAPETKAGEHHDGIFTQLSSGGWGARIYGEGEEGDTATLVTKANKRLNVTLNQRTWKGKDRYSGKYVEVWTFTKGGRRFATDAATGKQIDLTPHLVLERTLGVSTEGG